MSAPANIRRSHWRTQAINYLGLLLVLAALIAVFSWKTGHFFTPGTLRTIANQIPEAAVLAVGMTLVLLVGGIDLSVGSVLGLSGGVFGLALLQWHWPLPLAIGIGLAVGLGCGLLNGWLTVQFGLPSFIVTLGTLEAARGGAYLLTHSQTQYIGAAVETISTAAVFGLSLPFLLAIFIVMIAQAMLRYTVFGRCLFAVGGNEEAARFSGISTRAVKAAAFALCGLLASVAAVFNVARLATADPNAGGGFELQAIAAAVIGGTSLLGGRGSIIGSFLGVLILAVLDNGLAQIGAQEPHKRLITGGVIVLAVLLDVCRARLGPSKKP